MAKRAVAYLTVENADRQTARWLAAIRRTVAPRSQLRLVPQRCGLLVIDMQRYFTQEAGRCFLPASPVAVARIASLLALWRAHSGTILYTRHGHDGPGDLGMLGRFYADYLRGDEEEAEIIAALTPQPSDLVIRKKTYDAFLNTELETLLRRRHLDQVLIVGVLAHLCCETTARAAFCRGFEVYLAADATASRTAQLHFGALRGLADGVGVILGTREILDSCPSSM